MATPFRKSRRVISRPIPNSLSFIPWVIYGSLLIVPRRQIIAYLSFSLQFLSSLNFSALENIG